ncbi:restriction endonuclease subunit S [Paenibacillus sp. WC2504]|uniref:restriction endonuclease subunit S n=1 Tax=Paenibacillus sp. WC2504 TaxID=3461403 RepID=UPI004045EEF1
MTSLIDYFHEAVNSTKDIDKLKKLILQLAIKGKLVEQDLSDQPSSELLKLINEQKEQLIKHKKIRSEPVSSINTNDLAENPIPRGWALARIGQIMNPINGLAFKPTDWSNQGLPIIRIQNLNNLSAPFNYCDFEVDEKFIVNNGDILIGWSGTPGTSFGAFIWHRGKAVLNQHIFKAEMYGRFLNKEYIMYSINANLENMINKAHGAVGLQHITRGKFLDIILTIPPVNEQKRIVKQIKYMFDRLDNLSNEIVKKQKKSEMLTKSALAKLLDHSDASQLEGLRFISNNFEHFCNDSVSINQFRSSILSLAVQGKLVPQDPNDELASGLLANIRVEKDQLIKDKKIKKEKQRPPITEDEIPYELPQGWEWVRFSEITTFLNGDRGKNYPNKNEYVSQGIPWINTGHITKDGYLTTETMNYIKKEKYDSLSGGRIQSGDLVYCLRGATFGKTARIEPYETGAVASSLMIIRLIDIKLREYIFLYLRSPIAYMQLRQYDNGSAQPNLAAKDVAKYLIPFPPLNEQKRIVEKVDQLMALCDELEKTVEQSKQDSEMLMQAVLQEAFSKSSKTIVNFPVDNKNEIADWEIAARADGQINAETQSKISNRVAELLGKSHK